MTRKHVPTLLLAVFFALAAGLVPAILAIFLGDMFNSFTSFGAGDISAQSLLGGVTRSCLELLGLGAASWIANGAYYTLFIAFGELQANSARISVFGELLGRDLEWFESHQEGIGAFLSSLQAHVHELQMATAQPLGLALQYIFRTIASLGLAFYTSWNLSLVTLAGVPVLSAIIAFLSARIKPCIGSQQQELTQASKVVHNAVSSIDTVKVHNAQMFEAEKFSYRIDQAAGHYLKQARLNSLQIALIRFISFGMFVQGFWYGSELAHSGKLTSGEVLRTFWACLMATQSIEQVLPQAILLEQGKLAGTALKSILEDRTDKQKVKRTKLGAYPKHCEGDIEIRNLSFAYPSQPEKMVLKPSSFFFPAGDTIFVVGKSGSGKSTLSNLLTRFYSPSTGEILIDGRSIQTLDINWIRNNITLVEQKSVLFNESILTNIAFGSRNHESITKDDVQECIDLAMLESVLDTLPKGLDTCVGEGGSFLSGGQRQRVAIARARLRNTPILILDEPTSALDATNRVAVIKAIRQWRKDKTTIIITHDLSQILDNDYVYVMENGSIVQSGYKRQLVSQAKDESSIFFATKEALLQRADCKDTLTDDDMPELYSDSLHSDSVDGFEDELPDNGGSKATTGLPRRERSVSIASSYMQNSPAIRTSMHEYLQEAEFDNFPSNNNTSYKRERPDPAFRLSTMPRKRSLGRFRKQKKLRPYTKRHMASLGKIMSTIIPKLRVGQRCLLFLGFISALAHASAVPIFSYCLSQLLQTFYVSKDHSSITMQWSLAVLGVAFGDGIVSLSMHYFLEHCGQMWVDTLRKNAFRRVLDQPRSFFEKDRNRPLKLAGCLDQNAEEIRNIIGRFAGFVIVAVAIAVMAIVWSLIVCWKLTLVALACGPVIYAITRGFEKVNGTWEKRCNEGNAVIAGIFAETFSEIRTVRTLTLEAYFHKKHIKAVSRCMTLGFKRAVYSGSLFGIVESTIIFVSALIFYYGAVLVSMDGFTAEAILTVFSMLLFSIGYASFVLSCIPQINNSQDTATQLLRLVNLPECASHEHFGQIRLSRAAPIKLTRVNFRYPSRPDTAVLRDVSISIPSNSCTAIVGRSGSGKSTVASLLLSLYEAPVSLHGPPAVSVGGFDIRRLHTPTLRSCISIVSQQPTLFPDTIRANITYGLDESSPLNTMMNVRAAARAAGIDEFVSSLPKGYYTMVGDGGIGVSGGQAQRLVIARALLRQPQILVLDEATSALDVGSAQLIRKTVQQLVVSRPELTVIIITHSAEMMEIADQVVVMEQGRVVEEGPYTLLAKRWGGKLRALIEDEGMSSDG
ncbi:hypothetical protein ASPZODRAFT_134616 [Penicilliopsis zonata CBS 506.65]|uniref:ABC a-pheromone efflux pump AtrD n=1 Tax=Penicilliopsis zonata CBS 506.65 TaxID=1073090 RepID=A0A1L9SBK2_9EURO|nr:hypothetical protein ASPZODRAFT_134616 [Penicilliopsis zonata CBS 506.65]OJJ44536.1 hypothetical protein ASPZODRAFT_134616 [Penicilliopsis zonata CBS 506.65]